LWLIVAAGALAHVHPGLPLIAPALYLLVVSYPPRPLKPPSDLSTPNPEGSESS
jgi:hypothetical protein